MKASAFSSLFLSLFTLPLATALAYPPPCARGDFYVGGTSYQEAECIERHFMKPAKALRLQKREAARGNDEGPTRRSRSEIVRTVNLNPTSRRATVGGLVKSRNVRERLHAVKEHERTVNLRAVSGSRIHTSAERRDPRARANWSRRTKVEAENAASLH